jgi:hypothetical protein
VIDDGPDRKPTVSDERILAVFEKAADLVLKASEVAGQYRSAGGPSTTDCERSRRRVC